MCVFFSRPMCYECCNAANKVVFGWWFILFLLGNYSALMIEWFINTRVAANITGVIFFFNFQTPVGLTNCTLENGESLDSSAKAMQNQQPSLIEQCCWAPRRTCRNALETSPHLRVRRARQNRASQYMQLTAPNQHVTSRCRLLTSNLFNQQSKACQYWFNN